MVGRRTGQWDAINFMGGREMCKIRRMGSQETPLSPAQPQDDDNQNDLVIIAFMLCLNNQLRKLHAKLNFLAQGSVGPCCLSTCFSTFSVFVCSSKCNESSFCF